ncbi:hypothetical protein A0O34_15605 [Chryseobacterium glaciei]|uniref:DUF6705 domain-containing protein n=1 Tax=Chryseobacterium glaciei TaxID=1685010 RepID=A0A172XXX9_9FLAO|nr:DUF6705 family protein [Chryseobacterium glaciei]ANF51848.1 hypothetical protein A0O34_15605 [Chryseobacterium glaciei]
MKTINIKTIILFSFFISFFSCKAQEHPLNTDFRNLPDYSYLRDLNNELNPYIGTYTSTYNGNNITIYINKQEKKLKSFGSQKFYKDVLSIKFIVKNSSGNVLQDTQNMNFDINQIRHTIFSTMINPYHNLVMFSYGGTNCGVGWGSIYLKKLNLNQLSWEYRPNDMILDSSKCPNGTNINIYLPETKDLIFTKQ